MNVKERGGNRRSEVEEVQGTVLVPVGLIVLDHS